MCVCECVCVCVCVRSEEHTSELQSHLNLVCRLLLEIKRADGQTPVTCVYRRAPSTCNRIFCRSAPCVSHIHPTRTQMLCLPLRYFFLFFFKEYAAHRDSPFSLTRRLPV